MPFQFLGLQVAWASWQNGRGQECVQLNTRAWRERRWQDSRKVEALN